MYFNNDTVTAVLSANLTDKHCLSWACFNNTNQLAFDQ